MAIERIQAGVTRIAIKTPRPGDQTPTARHTDINVVINNIEFKLNVRAASKVGFGEFEAGGNFKSADLD
jgi:hypothetical protein